ncbi:hypothetical protein RvY_04951 [Ramazzottius varieornatus]|uniref:Angiotensin-converting enzyme n=1 Tax=Ramazzottius varieornatus TaxID=947166 RepID=A0A1D1UWJ8_RAMVA|nr:hypothetical protein RvY_04951 [Ramazzottius varieornatus]
MVSKLKMDIRINLGSAWTFLVLVGLCSARFHQVDISNLVQDTEPELNHTDMNTYVKTWLTQVYNPAAQLVTQADSETQWDYNVNITDDNQEATLLVSAQSANFTRVMATQLKKFDLNASDATIKRLHKKITELGIAALPDDDIREINKIIADMTAVFSTAGVCMNEAITDPKACPKADFMPLDPNITNFLRESRDTRKLRYIWKAWRDATGAKMRKNFIRYVAIKNKAAKLNGYADSGVSWRANYAEPALNYTDTDVLRDLEGLWQQIRPLYMDLHAYVRRKLMEKYPTENIRKDGPIPGHLLGNMWGQSWEGVLNFTQLFPDKPKIDVTDEMKRQNYTVDRMFRLSEQFQTNIGLKPMPPVFWNASMFERPEGREVVCHASAWDFYRNSEVRIKMCTDINMQDLITIHHEMGHIQYFLQYENQLMPFREGANSGFHEAVGDTLALSVSTPRHLASIGLLKDDKSDPETDLNFMYSTALEKIVFLPFGYIMDRYRYDVFSGKITSDRLNAGWWDYVKKYQGIAPPVERSEKDFDPGSKYHIAADVEYMRYFVSFVIQFQLHKALCNASGHTGPLYQCDINGSKAAGKLLGDMLSLGSSQPWPIAFEAVTGTRKMDAGALLEFFEPLTRHLQAINAKNGDRPGWTIHKDDF